MSIKKRLLLSNIGMVVIPVILFVLFEVIMIHFLLNVLKGMQQKEILDLFMPIRPFLFIAVLIISNGILTYFVSKSIITPLLQLKNAALEISNGNLDTTIEVNRTKGELNELATAFETMRVKLKRADALQKLYEDNQKELIASISHDLRTPLTSIKGYTRGISDGVANTPEKMEKYIQTIEKKADDMEYLIADLLLYAKLDLPNIPYEMNEIELTTYFEDYIEELRLHYTDKRVHFMLDYHPDHSYKVLADREKLNRVMNNIVQNSMKYMEKDEKMLKIRLLCKTNEVVVEIQDNGMGVPKEELSHLFERFYRTDVSRNSATGGSGLGLAIVKKIIEGHGGKVWAEGDTGQGLSIFFSLKKITGGEISEPDINN